MQPITIEELAVRADTTTDEAAVWNRPVADLYSRLHALPEPQRRTHHPSRVAQTIRHTLLRHCRDHPRQQAHHRNVVDRPGRHRRRGTETVPRADVADAVVSGGTAEGRERVVFSVVRYGSVGSAGASM